MSDDKLVAREQAWRDDVYARIFGISLSDLQHGRMVMETLRPATKALSEDHPRRAEDADAAATFYKHVFGAHCAGTPDWLQKLGTSINGITSIDLISTGEETEVDVTWMLQSGVVSPTDNPYRPRRARMHVRSLHVDNVTELMILTSVAKSLQLDLYGRPFRFISDAIPAWNRHVVMAVAYFTMGLSDERRLEVAGRVTDRLMHDDCPRAHLWSLTGDDLLGVNVDVLASCFMSPAAIGVSMTGIGQLVEQENAAVTRVDDAAEQLTPHVDAHAHVDDAPPTDPAERERWKRARFGANYGASPKKLERLFGASVKPDPPADGRQLQVAGTLLPESTPRYKISEAEWKAGFAANGTVYGYGTDTAAVVDAAVEDGDGLSDTFSITGDDWTPRSFHFDRHPHDMADVCRETRGLTGRSCGFCGTAPMQFSALAAHLTCQNPRCGSHDRKKLRLQSAVVLPCSDE